MSIKKIGVFISAVEAGSFTEGARRSNISQPAAVSIIDEIEATVGDELFVRHGKSRRATLTPRGTEVYEALVEAKAVYEQRLADLGRSNRKKAQQTVLIQLPYVSAISVHWFRNAIGDAKAAGFPAIRAADWKQIQSDMENRDECIALIDGEMRPKNKEYLPIGSTEMVLVTTNPTLVAAAQDERFSWEHIPAETMIYSGINPMSRERIYENLRMMTGTRRDQFAEANSLHILSSCIQQYDVPAIVPALLVNALRSCIHTLYCLPFAQSPVHVPLGLVMPYGYNNRLRLKRFDPTQIFDLAARADGSAAGDRLAASA